MKRLKEGSIEYFEIGNGPYTLLSIGKLHGDEERSKNGIMGAIEEIIANDKNSVRYVAIPEVNPSTEHTYQGINLNRDFGIFESEKTRSLDKIIKKYNPNFIVDHHDDIYSKVDICFTIIPYEAWQDEAIEVQIAKKIIKEMYSSEKLPLYLLLTCERLESHENRIIAKYFDFGIYRFLSNTENFLISYYKRSHKIPGIVVEISKTMQKEKAIKLHKKCDLIIKDMLEKLVFKE